MVLSSSEVQPLVVSHISEAQQIQRLSHGRGEKHKDGKQEAEMWRVWAEKAMQLKKKTKPKNGQIKTVGEYKI